MPHKTHQNTIRELQQQAVQQKQDLQRLGQEVQTGQAKFQQLVQNEVKSHFAKEMNGRFDILEAMMVKKAKHEARLGQEGIRSRPIDPPSLQRGRKSSWQLPGYAGHLSALCSTSPWGPRLLFFVLAWTFSLAALPTGNEEIQIQSFDFQILCWA